MDLEVAIVDGTAVADRQAILDYSLDDTGDRIVIWQRHALTRRITVF